LNYKLSSHYITCGWGLCW